MKNALFPRSEWSQSDDESEWSRMFRKIVNIMCEWSQLRRERMVAHDFANTSFWSPESAIWRSFFEGNVPIIIVLGPPVVPIDEIQVEPCLMMAALIGWSQTNCFSCDGVCIMLMHFPKTMRTRWFEQIRKRLPICPEWIQVTTMVQGPVAYARQNQ